MILVLGGTSESRDIAVLLVQSGFSVLYSTTTEIIDDLPPSVNRFIGMLDEKSFKVLLHQHKICCVVDATHPFAVQISALAIAVTSYTAIPYIRLERPVVRTVADSDIVKHVDTLHTAVKLAQMNPGRILSTLGTRLLQELITKLGERAEDLVARVLPTVESLAQCLNLNIHPSRICAMQGPFSLDVNLAIIKHFKIRTILSKESGDQGGLQEKINACIESGCMLIIIDRPHIEYPRVCSSASECLSILRSILQ
jgi:precorrin-6A/cobalt-precorrin-6A reductase